MFSVLFQVNNFGRVFGPIGKMFKEWGGLIGDIVYAAGVDVPLAMKLAEVSITLAANQVKDQFVALWPIIQVGFDILWQHVALTFRMEFFKAIAIVLLQLAKMFSIIPGMGGLSGRLEAIINNLNKKTAETQAKFNEVTKLRLQGLIEGYKVVESEETKAAKKAVEDAKNEVDKKAALKE